MQTIFLIILILYSSYLTLEKYVVTGRVFGTKRPKPDQQQEQIDNMPSDQMQSDLIGRSHSGVGQSVTNGDISRQYVSIDDNIDIFTPQMQPPLPRVSSGQYFPQSNITIVEKHVSPLSKDDSVSQEDAHKKNIGPNHLSEKRDKVDGIESSELRAEEIETDSGIEGRQARGITFSDMEAIHQVLDGSQQVSSQMQAQVRETFRRLEGTNVERLLRASILGSSEKLQRYMDLYLTAPVVPTSKQKTKESILGLFDIEEFV